jgi:septal ring factor EnvC (AmiA/AmiB activator)
MADLKAHDYRQMFLKEIGFPLIRANAERFVPRVGDLRKTENVKAVFEAAMQKKMEEHQRVEEKQKQHEAEIEALRQELELVRTRLEQVEEPEPNHTEEEPERQLAHYVGSVSMDAAEKIICAVLCSEQTDCKHTYRRLSKVFHPDTTSLPKDKAAELFALLRRLYEQVAESNNSFNSILGYDKSRSHEPDERKSWISKEDPDDIDF